MQTQIELSNEDSNLLDRLSERSGIEKEELIRRAIAGLVQPQKDAMRKAFGIWKNRDIGDSLEYLDKLRAELWG